MCYYLICKSKSRPRTFFYQFTDYDQKCVDAAANYGNQTLKEECEKERTKCKQNLTCNNFLICCNKIQFSTLGQI